MIVEAGAPPIKRRLLTPAAVVVVVVVVVLPGFEATFLSIDLLLPTTFPFLVNVVVVDVVVVVVVPPTVLVTEFLELL